MAGKKHNEDSLEQFFRKKAGEYDISYRDEDWMKLEKKLDLREVQLIYRRRLSLVVAAAILLISMLGYFSYFNHSRINELARQLDEETTPAMPETELPAIGDETPEVSDPPIDHDDLNRRTEPESPATLDPLPRPALVDAEKSVPDDHSSLVTSREDHHLSVSDWEANEIKSQLEEHIFDSAVTPARESFWDVPDVEEKPEEEAIATADAIETRPSSRFSVGFAMSPDLTSAEAFSGFQDTGYKLGITIEYKLTSNLAVSSGVIPSWVRYSARGTSYNPPSYFNDGLMPDDMTGRCMILDIPITLKYDFLQFDQSRFFATASLSSYIMLDEEYNFTYENEYGNLAESFSDQTGTRHWFSNAGLSVGYEFDFHQNWSLRAEPFVRLPLREVGWTNVQLYSMGSFLSVNYRL